MKIIFIGDIVAGPGRDAVKACLPPLIKDFGADLVIANAENIAHGRGITEETLQEMMQSGVDYFTSGDHVYWQKNDVSIFDKYPIIVPANFPRLVDAKGFVTINKPGLGKVLLINIMGRTFLNERLDDPFAKIDEILFSVNKSDYSAIIVDFHAEATSEKLAMGFYLDGRVDAVIGTHTHIPTCDQIVMPKGTMFIADAGMTGNVDSVLGTKKEIILELYLTGRNQKFEWEEKGRKFFRSVLINTETKEIKRFDKEA